MIIKRLLNKLLRRDGARAEGRALRPRGPRSVVTLGLLMVFGLVSQASTCNNPAPSCGVSCASNQVSVCGNRCRPIVGAGAPCTLDPCDANTLGICRGDGVGPALACQGTTVGATTGTCIALTTDTTFGCDPSTPEGRRCPEGMMCQASMINQPAGTHSYNICFPGDDNLQHGAAGLCRGATPEGSPCDGTWQQEVQNPGHHCLPCAGGLVCTDGICRRGCTADTDCACPSSGTSVRCDMASHLCEFCIATGQNVGSGGRCCDSRASNVNGRCLLGPGQMCTRSDECATENGCVGGRCQQCAHAGESATATDIPCCAGLNAVNGLCSVPCPAIGAVCTTTLPGECRSGHVTACTPFGQITCAPDRMPMGGAESSEQCDGLDNNCNGIVDDIPPRPCMQSENVGGVERVAPGNPACYDPNSPFHPTTGILRCDSAAHHVVCEAHEGWDYCTICGDHRFEHDSLGRTGMNCGFCASTPGCFAAGSLCTPNATCQSDNQCHHVVVGQNPCPQVTCYGQAQLSTIIACGGP